MNLLSQLEKVTQRMPSQEAMVFNDVHITYSQLLESIFRLASGLKRFGIKKGDRVAIMLPNVPHFCISYYAAFASGAVGVPLNFMNNVDEIMHQLNDSEAKLLITWQGFLKQIMPAFSAAQLCKHLLILGDHIPRGTYSITHLMAESEPLSEPEVVNPDDLAIINYTSGIADVPLGAELTHQALLNNAMTCREMFLITLDEVSLAVLPLFHPLGQTMVMNASFISGAKLVLMARFAPESLISTIQKNNVTLMAAVPNIYRALIDAPIENMDVPSLKYCMSYGGPLSLDMIQEFEKKFNTYVLKAYGLTEAGPLVSSTRIDRDRKPESNGLPIVGTEVQIRDENGNILPPNSSGEICVRNQSLMSGYHNQPNETKNRLVDGWLITGDIGYLDLDHYLFVQERKEDIIKKGGFSIFPSEVEKHIIEHPCVEEAAVIAVPDKVQDSEVKAFVVLKENNSITSEELAEYCRKVLPVYKCPKYIEFVSSLPKSATGRMLKRFLRNRPQASPVENDIVK